MLSSLTFFLLQQKSLLLRSEKIYSVLSILLVIFTAILIYLWLTNRKVKQIEARIQKLEHDEFDE